jgi:hypothetical protein
MRVIAISGISRWKCFALIVCTAFSIRKAHPSMIDGQTPDLFPDVNRRWSTTMSKNLREYLQEIEKRNPEELIRVER